MSVAVHYRRKSRKDPVLEYAGESLVNALKCRFGEFPLTLHPDDAGAIHGIAATHPSQNRACNELISKLNQLDYESDGLELTLEY